MSIRHSLFVVLGLLCLSVPAWALEVTPASRVLVLDAGKGGVIKIKDTDGCKPTWTAVSDNPSVVSVSPASTGAGASRSFKVKTTKDVFPAMANVTVTMTGAGATCDQTVVTVIQVVVVRKQKHAESMAKQAAAQNLKAFKGNRKAAEKALAQSYTELLASAQADLEAIDDGKGAEGLLSVEEQKAAVMRDALLNSFALRLFFFSALMNSYLAFGNNVAIAAYSAVISYAYLPFIAVTLLVGGGGIWDGFVANLLRFSLLSAGKGLGLSQKFLLKLSILALAHGIPFSQVFLPFSEGFCFPALCGPSNPASSLLESGAPGLGGSPAAALPAEELALRLAPGDPAQAGIGVAALFKLQLLGMFGWTHFFAGPQASLMLGGLANPSDGDVTVNATRLPGGSPIPVVATVNPVTGSWLAFFAVGAGLLPGKYEVDVEQGGTRLRRVVDLAAR
jgi:hypothetical protein